MNYGNESLTVEDIAVYADVSVSHLRAVFKEHAGIPPNEYLTQVRIAQAKELLATTAFTTPQIAAAVGYSSTRYFYSVFKKNAGCTPTDYQKGIRAAERAAQLYG